MLLAVQVGRGLMQVLRLAAPAADEKRRPRLLKLAGEIAAAAAQLFEPETCVAA